MKWIIQFVLKQFAKRSAKKTGIASLKKASDSIVKSNVRNIEIILKDMGVDIKNLKSTDDVLKHMNTRQNLMDQALKKQAEKLFPPEAHKFFGKPLTEKDFKEIDKLYPPKKGTTVTDDRPFPGWKPKVVSKETEAEVLARIKKQNKEAVERLKAKKKREWWEDIPEDEKGPWDKPEEPWWEDDFASGGVAGQLHLNEGGRTGFKKGSMRERLQKDYKSYARLSDYLKSAPPNFWLSPEKYGMTRDDAMTYLKERFMYGDLDKSPSPAEVFKKSPELVKFKEWWDNREDNASGGIAGQLHLNEGGRVPMIFGGSLGLRAMWKSLLKYLSKGRDKPVTKFFPKLSVKEKKLLELGKTYLPRESKELLKGEKTAKIKGIEILIERLKADKAIIARQAKNKAMNDPSLNFLMKDLEDTVYPSHLKKYKDIDKDILQMETIKKNLIMKDRKLNAEGGIAGQLHLNRPGFKRGTRQEKEMRDYRFQHDIPRQELTYPYRDMIEEQFAEQNPDVYAQLKKDPVFNWKEFQKVGWSTPEETRIAARKEGKKKEPSWGYTTRSGHIGVNYLPFGEKETIGGIISLKTPSDTDKVSTILHEMRHKKFKNRKFWESKAVPEWVRKEQRRNYDYAPSGGYIGGTEGQQIGLQGKPHFETTAYDLTEEELYSRFLDQRVLPSRPKDHIAGSKFKPYFDKILRDKWEPHAKAYREYLETENLPNPRGMRQYKYLAKGGLARVLGV